GFLGEFSALAVRHNVEKDVGAAHEYKRTVAETDTQSERGDPKRPGYLYPEDIKRILEGSPKVKHLIQEDGRVNTQSLDWEEIKRDEKLCRAIKLNNAHLSSDSTAWGFYSVAGQRRELETTCYYCYIRSGKQKRNFATPICMKNIVQQPKWERLRRAQSSVWTGTSSMTFSST
ncbi:hypothetical protein THAOC_23772, partial [Thalassiosira oceanica]